jgi:hypothetical protein
MKITKINSDILKESAEDIINSRMQLLDMVKYGQNPGDSLFINWITLDDIIDLYCLLKSKTNDPIELNQLDTFNIKSKLANLVNNVPIMKMPLIEKICNFVFQMMNYRVFHNTNVEMGIVILLLLLEKNFITIEISDTDLYNIFYHGYYQYDALSDKVGAFREFHDVIREHCTNK